MSWKQVIVGILLGVTVASEFRSQSDLNSISVAFDSILVSTGRPTATKTEIINLDQEPWQEVVTCKDLEEYPWKVYGALGFNMGSLPVICGGRDESGPIVNQCLRLESGRWQPFANLTQGRYGSAGISHAQSFIIFGGNDVGGSGDLKSTEIITEQGASAGPEMQEAVSKHAIAVVNETTSILTGGCTDGIGLERFRHLNKTWFFNHVSQQFQTGPRLITGRYDHTSATIQDKVTMENIVAVFGGTKATFNDAAVCGGTKPTVNDAYLDSVELLINGESEWQQGPQMPKKLLYHSTVEIGGDIYTIGGYSIDDHHDYRWQSAIYQMSCSFSVCKWTTMTQKLKVARLSSVAIPIPKSLCIPTTKTTREDIQSDVIEHINEIYFTVLKSEECMQKIACEVGALARAVGLTQSPALRIAGESVPSRYKTYYKHFTTGKDCHKINCGII